jgi:carbonic anhydrase
MNPPASSSSALLERNRAYATERHSELPPAPRLPVLVVTCLDARTDPAHFLGLDAGDALVLRNMGGRVTPAVEREIGLLAALTASLGLGAPEVFLVHHTRCGMQRLADAATRATLAAASGLPEAEIAALAIHDHQQSLREDLDRLSGSGHLPEGMRVKGLLLDLGTGRMELRIDEVVR